MTNSNLVAKVIVDKNGHQKTVHVRPENASSKSRVSNSTPVSASAVNLVQSKEVELLTPINAAMAVLDDPNFKRFPLEIQSNAIKATNSPDATPAVYERADELAQACESWNFHDTALKLWAAIGRAEHAEDPEAPLTEIYSMAYDPATPPELLNRIYVEIGDGASSLAQNTSATTEILEGLSKSERGFIREEVAKNPSTDWKILEQLSKDPEWRVRWSVTENKETPMYVLDELKDDENAYVKEGAGKALRKHSR